MSIGRTDKPEHDLALEEGQSIDGWIIARLQQVHDRSDTGTALVLVFLRRRNAESLATILLGQADQAPAPRPSAIEPFDNQGFGTTECLHLAIGRRQAECARQRHTVEFVLDAVRQVDAVRQPANLRLQYVRRRRDAMGTQPLAFVQEQGGLFLSACDRDAKLAVKIDVEPKRSTAEIGEHRGYIIRRKRHAGIGVVIATDLEGKSMSVHIEVDSLFLRKGDLDIRSWKQVPGMLQ